MTKRYEINFDNISMPKIIGIMTEEQKQVLEDFPFDEIVNESKTISDLIKNIKSNIDDFDNNIAMYNHIVKLYGQVGVIDDVDTALASIPFPRAY